jgi:polar amino acid transport system substrate-binding protein
MRKLRAILWALAALALATPAAAAPLAQIKERNRLSMCAHPDALPYAREKGAVNGFQIDLGRALAAALGVGFEARWIIPSYRARLVDCDVKMDFIVAGYDPESRVSLSKPYARSGVALAVGPGHDDINDFKTVRSGRKIGVMLNSVASKLLNVRGWQTSPYVFEQEMFEDIESGALAAGAASTARVQYYLHENPGKAIRVVLDLDDEPEFTWTVAVAMLKADQALVDAINEALGRMMDDGTLEQIYARYGIAYRKP